MSTSPDSGTSSSFYTLESTPDFLAYNSASAASISHSGSLLSPQCSQYSYTSDRHNSSGLTIYDSPMSGSLAMEDDNMLMHALWVLRSELPCPQFDNECSFDGSDGQQSLFSKYDRIILMAQNMDLKELLIACADIVSEVSDSEMALSATFALLEILEKKVSVSGDPLQRLGAYMLEGVRARLLNSGSAICRRLKCKEPITPAANPSSSELMSYMGVIYQICPYFKFAYVSSSVIIEEAMWNENRIHIIDFQIAQGSQWVSFIEKVSRRPGGPPYIRITGVDDPQSAHARGGGLGLVGQKLANVAESRGVPFEFHGAALPGTEIRSEHLLVRQGDAIAVNFPYVLHHIPDESVSIENHRDRLLRLVKSFSPKVVTLIEQECNTNTTTFFRRFCESLDYYTAMFESIDAASSREDPKRIRTEENCVAKDVVNIIACEGHERVERHEPFGKWVARLTMAGFAPLKLSPGVRSAAMEMLKGYSPNYGVIEGNGALWLRWKNKYMSNCSAWR